MDEYNRIILEEYCHSHNSKKAKRLEELVYRSYDVNCDAWDADFIFLDQCFDAEKDDKIRDALKDLESFLGGW